MPAREEPSEEEGRGAGETRRARWGVAELAAIALIAGAAALIVANFRDGHLLAQRIWDDPGPPRFALFAAIYTCFAAPLLIFAPRAFAGAMLGAAAALSILILGPVPVLGAAYFLLSAFCLGWLLLGGSKRETLSAHVCATILGIAVWVAVMYAVARAPVNYPAVWLAALAVPIAMGWRGVVKGVAGMARTLSSRRMRNGGTRLALALVAFLAAMHWYIALTPENGDDALAAHLAVPANIAAHHALTYSPDRYAWAVMPMGADLSYAIAYLLGGEGAARLINFAMLMAAAVLLYGAARRWLGPGLSLLLAAAFLSTPMAQLVTGSLFVENLQAALVFASVACLWHFGETGERRFFFAASALAGSALSVKVGSVAFAAATVPVAVWEARRRWKSLGPFPAVACLLAAALFLAAAAPPYAIALLKTGNPLFPFLNNRFHSPLMPPGATLVESRFKQSLSWRTLPDLVFHSTRYYEGQDGSFGFQYLLVVPLGLAALAGIRKRNVAGSAALVAAGAGLMVMLTEPNARYVYPTLPLITAAFGGALGWYGARNRWILGGLVAFLVAAIALNIWFMPASSFYHKDFGMPQPFSATARERYLEDTAPVRAAARYLNRNHPGAPVLLTSDSAIADLQGDVYENHWHQMNTADAIRRAPDVDSLLRLFAKWNVKYFIARDPDSGGPTHPDTLAQLLNACVIPEFRLNYVYVGRLDRRCSDQGATTPGGAASGATPSLAGPMLHGWHDDTESAMRYAGQWTHDRAYAEPAYGRTISYSDVKGDSVSFAFEGPSVTYVFTRAFNRGIAEVSIDGASAGQIDLYSAKIEWRSERKFGGLAPGSHVISVQVTGRKRDASQGYFVDLDAFVLQ